MKVTIVPADGAVSIDGVGFGGLDLSTISTAIHAVQWYDTYGEVEFKDFFVGGAIVKPENQLITSFSEYEPVIALWQTAKDTEEDASVAAANNQPVGTGVQEL